jgi:hypothetical protein
MIVTVEVRSEEDPDRRAVLASMRIVGPGDVGDATDFAVGAIEGAAPSAAAPARSRGSVVAARDRGGDVWSLIECACAAIREADFVDLAAHPSTSPERE